MIKIVFISIASIGQIDRRFLAEGVGQIGPLEFDPYPTIHVRDLVAHEAHRHPYIEILGTVYLMKLRYSRDFGSRAGSAWRLMFIYALMPWMHQYRIQNNADRGVVDANCIEAAPPADPGEDTRELALPEQLPPLRTSPRTGNGLVNRENELTTSWMPPSPTSITTTSDDVDAHGGVEAPPADLDGDNWMHTLSEQLPSLGNSAPTNVEPMDVENASTMWIPQSSTSVTATSAEVEAEVEANGDVEPMEVKNASTMWIPHSSTSVTATSDEVDAEVEADADVEAPTVNLDKDNRPEQQPPLRNSSRTSIGSTKAENRWVLWMRQSRTSVRTAFFDANGDVDALEANPNDNNRVSTLPEQLQPLKNSSRISVRRLEEENRLLREQINQLLGIDG